MANHFYLQRTSINKLIIIINIRNSECWGKTGNMFSMCHLHIPTSFGMSGRLVDGKSFLFVVF